MVNPNLTDLAFPSPEYRDVDHPGLTKHEYAAIHLAAAMVSQNSKVDYLNETVQENISNAAYKMAQMLLNKFK